MIPSADLHKPHIINMQVLHVPAGHRNQSREATPTTTPRTASQPQLSDSTTPTRANSGTLPSQEPRPTEPLPTPAARTEDVPDPPGRQRPGTRDGEDVDMEASDESRDQSEGSVNADEPGKKKKSQRFYCTDYPPCTLSFTRSEHLARHIR